MTDKTPPFAALTVDWALEAHDAFCPNAPKPEIAALRKALRAINGCTTSESVLSIGWAALGSVLPSRSALGIALLTLETSRIGLETPEDLMAIRTAASKEKFGTTAWKIAVETAAKDRLKPLDIHAVQ